MCEVIRNYNIRTGQYSIVHIVCRPIRLCQGPMESILILSRKRSQFLVSKLKLETEQWKLWSDESWHVDNELLQMCCTNDMLVVLNGNKERVEAMKLGSNIPIWKLSGEVYR